MASHFFFLATYLLLASTPPLFSEARLLSETSNTTSQQPHSPLDRIRPYQLTSSSGCGVDNLLASYSQVEAAGGCALTCDAYKVASLTGSAPAVTPHRCNAYVQTADGSCLLYSDCAKIVANDANSTVGIANITDEVICNEGVSLGHSGDVIYARFDAASCEGDSDLGTFPTDEVDCQGICNIVPGCNTYVDSPETCKLFSSCSLIDDVIGSVTGVNIYSNAGSSAGAGRSFDDQSNAEPMNKPAAFTYLHKFHCSEDNIGQTMIPGCDDAAELCTSKCAELCSEASGCFAFMLKYTGKCKFYGSCSLKAVSTPDYVGVMHQP
uniref:Apple domain-containing protein n=1 Tax=Tetraselmis chuii TaxID=63592 RepID=A0A7S1WZ55_9CHLO|mmetsp:Transcript_11717/g.21128  ORF Transcript_11717/g.21128 Transcript_11717/m.21128 type:complete len:323 (+) Transcript_11717:178-1146(+)|eukprot:CAMPEP_0177771050 /NCGR_PEP_ID=MMETSP0491_2-20121128/11320_1 /TAXON_ID=63592 /ORGANISM="Tetraselmis chuii, Strain PLY429" /LENGTH=322 /DNA_ID=CAMNT_0019288443 /DNA_START=110 /DNA_END=1078 /DNA_ORIENTATION=-